jgi:uncharacterized protein YbaR (Trm112 family)
MSKEIGPLQGVLDWSRGGRIRGRHANYPALSAASPAAVPAPAAGPDAFRREPLAFLEVVELLRCPVDMRPLRWSESEGVLHSSDEQRRYPVVDGIPCLFAPNQWPDETSDVTDIVKAFYEDTPFPNYDDPIAATG